MLKLYTKVLGAKHLYTLISMNNVAYALDSQSKYAEAEAMHRQVLKLRTKVLGAEHPDTLTSMSHVAAVHRVHQGQGVLPLHSSSTEGS